MSSWSSFAIVFFDYLKQFGVKCARTDLVPVAFGSRTSSIATEMHPNPMGSMVKDKSSMAAKTAVLWPEVAGWRSGGILSQYFRS